MPTGTRDTELLSVIWGRLVGGPLSPQRLVGQLRRDGGHDISVLSDVELLELVEGRFAGDWHKPAFAFSEMLACYSVVDLAPDQVVGWVFSVLAIADCLDREETDLEFQFINFINGYHRVGGMLLMDEWIYIFERLFCRTCPAAKGDCTP